MTDSVLIPCWRRPEFLLATLTRIKLARGAEDLHYLFTVDRGSDPRVHEVIEHFPYHKRKVIQHHPYRGPAYNILEGYRELYRSTNDGDRIYLIEDDVFIAEDFFEFHDEAWDLDDEAKIVSACRNQNLPKLSNFIDATSAVYRHVSYQSLGVSFDRRIFPEILEHASRAYYLDPIEYCATRLSDKGLPESAASQDGLIHRIVRKNLWWTIYPITPRAFHAGFYGLNRHGIPLSGSVEEAASRLLIMSDQEMNQLADPDFRDIEQCGLIRPKSVELRLTVPVAAR